MILQKRHCAHYFLFFFFTSSVVAQKARGTPMPAIAISLGTTLQAASVVTWLASAPVLSEFYHLGLREVPMLLAGISFTFLYWFFPNTQVKFGSAVLGGM